MKIVSKIALVATFGLALAFTFSCSDDDKGGWLTCQELESLKNKCGQKYLADEEACVAMYDGNKREEYEACWDKLHAKLEKCVMPDACNGTSSEECDAHYESMGCFDDDGKD